MKLRLLFTLLLFHTGAAYAQVAILPGPLPEGLLRFSKSYFRSDPFATNFSSFLQHLVNDPALHDKFTQSKTDTTLYTFFGVYNNYNPFFFTPKRMEILLEEKAVKYADSTKPDTIFYYQLMAYANDDAHGEADIKKEFDKINKQNSRKFISNKYDGDEDGDVIKAEMYSYFVPYYGLSPLSVIRGKLADSHEWVLNLTLRFKLSENHAILAAPFYSAQ